jgi:3D (Asp-Asp-Asp) domain-containing protein
MNKLQKLSFLWPVFAILAATSGGDGSGIAPNFDFSEQNAIITNVFATGYYCVYNSEIDGRQTVNMTISNNSYALKASFLFGGRGVAMQGTGRTSPDGDYIKYTGGAACFVYLAGVNAGRNLDGQWVANPRVLRNRYAKMGITDFTGFGNLALLYPARATFSICSANIGSSGQLLDPWSSIAVDTSLIPLGQTLTISSKNEATTLYNGTNAVFRADDTGGFIKGRRIDIYLGEGQSAWERWLQSGGNRYVDIYLTR